MGQWAAMRQLRLARLPLLLLSATVALEIAAVVLSWGLEPRYDTVLYAVNAVTLAGAGALIASRHPQNAIGWLLLGQALLGGLAGDAAQGWGLRAAQYGWPAGTAGEWVSLVSWLPSGLIWTLIFLSFPHGRLLSRFSRVVAWTALVGTLVALAGWSFSPDMGSEFVGGRNPMASDWLPTGVLYPAGLTLFLLAFVAAIVVLIGRFIGSRGVERQQLKWFVSAAALAGLILPVSAALWNVAPIVRPLAALALTALPIAACIAILRYRLYDIDVVINRTVVYTVLSAVLATAYAASALVMGTAVGRDSAWATAGATLVVAVAFRPVRDRVQAGVDRRFSRARYDAVSRVATFLEDLRAGRATPEHIEGVLRQALGVDRLEVRLFLPESEQYVDMHGLPVDDDQDDGRDRWPIRRGGATLGAVVADVGEEKRLLLPKLLDAGTLAIEIARLRVELRRQLEEVDASRARIVAAGDEERRRIERDLHDGAQQRLVSIGLALRHAQHALGPAAPEAFRALDSAVAEITVAIDELRELARGLRPAQLDAGLGPALRELARRAPLPVEVDVVGDRFAPEVETAAYFTACEGLTNAVKHGRASKVLLNADRADGSLVISVADDGIGGATPRLGSGLTGLSDRVAAQGGILTIESSEGRGTTLTAEFPCGS